MILDPKNRVGGFSLAFLKKAFPIQQDERLLTVLHCVERNPVRGAFAAKAEDWFWSNRRRRWLTRDGARTEAPRLGGTPGRNAPPHGWG